MGYFKVPQGLIEFDRVKDPTSSQLHQYLFSILAANLSFIIILLDIIYS